jgi:hypothetical protein
VEGGEKSSYPILYISMICLTREETYKAPMEFGVIPSPTPILVGEALASL